MSWVGSGHETTAVGSPAYVHSKKHLLHLMNKYHNTKVYMVVLYKFSHNLHHYKTTLGRGSKGRSLLVWRMVSLSLQSPTSQYQVARKDYHCHFIYCLCNIHCWLVYIIIDFLHSEHRGRNLQVSECNYDMYSKLCATASYMCYKKDLHMYIGTCRPGHTPG